MGKLFKKAPRLRKLSDEDVMEYFQGGYEEGFNILVERYQDKIYNFIYRYTRCHEDCEDLVQETFLRVFRSKHAYERIAKFSTWLYTIALNLAKSHYKRSSRMTTVSISGVDEHNQEKEIEIADLTIGQDEVLNDRINIGFVEKALDCIPPEFKEVVVLRDLQHLTYEEIMEITGLPMGTVKSRINRGRVRLQKYLKKVIDTETISA